jgi:hypothetical protein
MCGVHRRLSHHSLILEVQLMLAHFYSSIMWKFLVLYTVESTAYIMHHQMYHKYSV